jgi:hypothetical protein
VDFIDIRRAFDVISHPHLLFRLHQAGVAGNVLRAISGMFTDRKFYVQDGYTSSRSYSIGAGTPQGCVLSPTLFLIYINSALNLAASCDVVIFAYADDLAVMPSTSLIDPRSTDKIKALQRSLNILSLWSSNWCVQFSKEKSQLVIFTRRKLNVTISPPELKLAGFTLQIVDQYSYLGYPLHKHLSWKQLRDEIISGINSRNFLISKIISAKGLKFPAIRLLCLNYSRSALNYYLPLARFSESDYELFDSRLLRPFRSALHIPRYTPTHRLLGEFGINPMIIQAKISLLSHIESILLELPPDYLQSIRIEKEWLHPFYVPFEVNYSHMDSVARLARSYLKDLPITLSLSDFMNPLRIRHDPIKTSVSNLVTLQYACDLTKAELQVTKRKYPFYLVHDKLDVAMMRIRLRLRVSRLNADLQRFHLCPHTFCPHCTEPMQDANHMIMRCPVLEQLRRDTVQQLINIGITASTNLFLGHVVHLPEQKQLEVLRITGKFLVAAKLKHYEF